MQFRCDNRLIYVWLAGVMAVLLSSAARSDEGAEVRILPELRIVAGTAKNPTYRYVPAVQVAEGEEIFYTVQVRNGGERPLEDYALVLPVPENTRYVPHTAAGAGAAVTFSVDGAQSFAPAERVRVASSRYTHIRWQWSTPLAPGAVVLVRFRAIFE